MDSCENTFCIVTNGVVVGGGGSLRLSVMEAGKRGMGVGDLMKERVGKLVKHLVDLQIG